MHQQDLQQTATAVQQLQVQSLLQVLQQQQLPPAAHTPGNEVQELCETDRVLGWSLRIGVAAP